MKELTDYDRFLERQRIADERALKMGYGKAVQDAIVGGVGITKNGERIDPASIYAQQDIPDLIAGALGVSRGTAYDMMREALAEQPAQQKPLFKPLIDLHPGLAEEMKAMNTPAQQPVACKTLCELCIKRGYDFCANAAKTTPIPASPAQPLTEEDNSKLFDSLIDEMLAHSYQGSHDSAEKVAIEIRRMYKAAHGITKGNT